MSVPFGRTAVTSAWFVAFGLLALLWSPPSVAMGVLVLLAGLVCPAAMLVLWKEPAQVVAVTAHPLGGSRSAR